MTVGILNLGISIEQAGLFLRSSTDFLDAKKPLQLYRFLAATWSTPRTVPSSSQTTSASSKAVSTAIRGIASVAIASLDHVLFSNNQLWVDGRN